MLKKSLIALKGTVIAQGIGFLFMPVLTRVYSPDAFGSFQFYSSILMMLLVVASLRYEYALLKAERGGEDRAVLRLCLTTNVTVAVAALIGLGLAAQFSSALIHHLDAAALITLAFAVLAGGVYQFLGYVFFRFQELGAIAQAKILQVTGFSVIALALATWFDASHGLITADAASRVFALGLLTVWLWRNKRQLFGHVSWQSMRSAAVKFRDYPRLSVPGALLTAAIGFLLPVFMLKAFGTATLGQYALIERTILAPAAILGQSVAQAFTAQLSNDVQSGKSSLASFRRTIATMLMIGLVPALVLAAFGPQLVVFVFGDTWHDAGSFSRPLSLVFLLSVALAPVNMTLIVLDRQRLQLAWESGRLVLLIACWAAILQMSLTPLQAIYVHTAFSIASGAAFLWISDRTLREMQPQPARP